MADTHFIYIADVYCPWCYGFAPIMKRIADEHPDWPVQVIGGNLISRPLLLAEDYAANPDLIDFWHEVEKTTGRSLAGAIEAVLRGREVRMYSPGADELLVALRSFAPGHQLEQLIELEDLFYGQGRDLFVESSLDEMAKRWNIPAGSFANALNQPEAERATAQNLAQAAELMGEIGAYPSVLLARDGKLDVVSRGYVHYETVAARLESAIADLAIPATEHKGCSRQSGCTVGRH